MTPRESRSGVREVADGSASPGKKADASIVHRNAIRRPTQVVASLRPDAIDYLAESGRVRWHVVRLVEEDLEDRVPHPQRADGPAVRAGLAHHDAALVERMGSADSDGSECGPKARSGATVCPGPDSCLILRWQPITEESVISRQRDDGSRRNKVRHQHRLHGPGGDETL